MNYGYSGYSLVRHMKRHGGARRSGEQSASSSPTSPMATMPMPPTPTIPRVRWRYDPAQAGVSAQFADCGIHALHMASFVTGQNVEKLSADCVACIDSARVGRRRHGQLPHGWRHRRSALDVVNRHRAPAWPRNPGLSAKREALRWSQEQPNQLYYMPLGAAPSGHRTGRSEPVARKPTAPPASPSAMPRACPWPLPTSTKTSPR